MVSEEQQERNHLIYRKEIKGMTFNLFQTRKMPQLVNLKMMVLICCLLDTTISAPIQATEEEKPCFNCADLNQKWRTSQCSATEYDCGDCLDGYSRKSETDNCKIEDDLTVEDGQSVAIREGATVTISCHFNTNVDCAWQRRGQYVEMGGRYRFLVPPGENTRDCSIEIIDFSFIDVGHWSCETFADQYRGGLRSTNAWLSMRDLSGLYANDDTKSTYVPTGEKVHLPCHFPNEVHCAWLRRGFYVEIGQRYSFTGPNRNGEDTKDCSILIQGFNEIDEGQWECQSMADAHQPGVHKPAKTLNLVKKHQITYLHIPRNQTVKIGGKVTLECQLNYDVTCNWTRNGQPITITDRYRHTDTNNGVITKHCDIEISDIKVEDEGTWTCDYQTSLLAAKSVPSKVELQVEPEMKSHFPVPPTTQNFRFMKPRSHNKAPMLTTPQSVGNYSPKLEITSYLVVMTIAILNLLNHYI